MRVEISGFRISDRTSSGFQDARTSFEENTKERRTRQIGSGRTSLDFERDRRRWTSQPARAVPNTTIEAGSGAARGGGKPGMLSRMIYHQ